MKKIRFTELRPAPCCRSRGGVESTADLAQLSRQQRCQSVQNAAHKWLQMNHAVRRRSNDHDLHV